MQGFMTEFKYTLRRLRGQILGWGIGLALYGLMMGGLFDSVNQIEGLDALLASYPPEMMAFFGDIAGMNTPSGYLSAYYGRLIPLIVGIFATSAAAGLLAGDEERGTLDLTLAYPVGRSGVFWGRWLGFVVALALVLLMGWAGLTASIPFYNFDATAGQLLRMFAPMWAFLMVFAGLALLLSLVLPSARAAAMTAGGLLVANFLFGGMTELNDALRPIMDLTPYAFLQSGDALQGLNWGWLAGLTAAALLLSALAWLLFRRRDIRVGGEREWSWRPSRSSQ